MTGKNEQSEPTMEEILASIRRIISEENDESAPPSAASGDGKPAAVAPEPALSAEAREDVLELTEVVEEDIDLGEAEDIDFDMESEQDVENSADADSDPGFYAEPKAEEEEPESVFAAATESEVRDNLIRDIGEKIVNSGSDWTEPVDPADEADAIMGEAASAQARSAFQGLSDLLVAGYQGADNTLEAMVRRMLKPMLQSWLDQHLPDIVERAVAREIARLSRSKRM